MLYDKILKLLRKNGINLQMELIGYKFFYAGLEFHLNIRTLSIETDDLFICEMKTDDINFIVFKNDMIYINGIGF